MAKLSTTGYVHQMLDKNEPFEKWVWTCARAFGALILMRDDPMDAPIPEKLEPDSYHSERIAEIKAEIDRLKSLSPEECIALARKEQDERVRDYERVREEEAAELEKVAAMRSIVSDWQPPTSDHSGLKCFMLEQLDMARGSSSYYAEQVEKHKNDDPAACAPNRIRELEKEIVYHQKEHAEEVKRTEQRNKWIYDLRDSLNQNQHA